jgi:hypothetical protein
MRLKRRILSIVLGLTVCLILMTTSLQAAQKSIKLSTGSYAYVLETSLCGVFITDQNSTRKIPIYQLLADNHIRLLDFLQTLRPALSISSQYYTIVVQYYNENCKGGSAKGFNKYRSSRLSAPLLLTQNQVIEMPESLGDISLSCNPRDDADPIDSTKTFVVRWIESNCPSETE